MFGCVRLARAKSTAARPSTPLPRTTCLNRDIVCVEPMCFRDKAAVPEVEHKYRDLYDDVQLIKVCNETHSATSCLCQSLMKINMPCYPASP